MSDKKIHVSVRDNFKDRLTPFEYRRTSGGWSNVDLSIEQFVDHIKNGYPFTHQFVGGKKIKDRFLRTNILVADIDSGLTIDQALEHDFVKAHATFLYTTPRHQDDGHRFRIVFVLDRTVFDSDSYESMYGGLMKKIPQTDPAVQSAAQFFQGNSNAKLWMLNKTISDKEINKLISDGVKLEIEKYTPPPVEKLTPSTLVKVKGRTLRELHSLDANTTVTCPFGTHEDKNPSAFVIVSRHGIRGVQCRSCGEKQWSEPLPIEDQFGMFDRLVKEYAGRENSHFPYQGLTQFDHTLETSMGKSNFHVTCSEHVDLRELLPGIHLIKSPKATGKTELMSMIVSQIKDPTIRQKLGLSKDNQGKTILIGHRQTLIRESAQKLGLECYLDTGGYDTQTVPIGKFESGTLRIISVQTKKPQHYAVCLDSLSSRVRPAYEQYDVVIIDESEQVFSHFLSEHMSHPTANFEILSKLIKKAKLVFLLDADLDRITLTGVISCLSKPTEPTSPYEDVQRHDFQKLYCHLNTYLPPKRTIELYVGKNHLQAELINDIQAGKRCFVSSNSKKFIEGLHDVCLKAFGNKSFELIVSDRGDDEDVRRFLKNIKVEILTKDALFSSPSIGTGIDITFPGNSKKVDVVYGFFETNVNTHFDIDQQLGRVRHPGQVKVWISPSRNRATTNLEKIRQEILFNRQVEGLQYFLDQEGAHAAVGRHPFVDLLATVIAVRRQSMNRLRDNFIAHKKSTGWDIVEIRHNDVAAQLGQAIGKASRVTRTKNVRSRLLSAYDLSDTDRMKLDSRKEKNLPMTDEEKAALEKYWIRHFYRQDVTNELLEFDDEGKTREKIALLEKVIDKKNTLTKYEDIPELTDWELGSRMTPDQLRQPVFLREIFVAAGIFDLNTMSFSPDVTYTTVTLAKFVRMLKSKKVQDRFTFVFGKEINEHLEERPVGQLGSILKMVGLSHKVIKKNKGGGMSTYQIDPIRYQEITGIIEHRSSRPTSKRHIGE